VVEHASLPHLSKEERCRHLNFVVVGGGPTGVELAAELHDFVQEDVARLMPHLKVCGEVEGVSWWGRLVRGHLPARRGGLVGQQGGSWTPSSCSQHDARSLRCAPSLLPRLPHQKSTPPREQGAHPHQHAC
jgi:hypothetical protein